MFVRLVPESPLAQKQSVKWEYHAYICLISVVRVFLLVFKLCSFGLRQGVQLSSQTKTTTKSIRCICCCRGVFSMETVLRYSPALPGPRDDPWMPRSPTPRTSVPCVVVSSSVTVQEETFEQGLRHIRPSKQQNRNVQRCEMCFLTGVHGCLEEKTCISDHLCDNVFCSRRQ